MKATRLNATWPFQALADGTRFRVVRLLASTQARLSPTALARTLQVAPAHLSRHLQVLHAAGLTQVDRQGHRRHIATQAQHPAQCAVLAAVCAMPDETGVFARDQCRLNALRPTPLPAPASASLYRFQHLEQAA